MKTLLWQSLARQEIAARVQQIPGIDLVLVDNAEQLIPALPDCDVLMLPGHCYDRRMADALRTHAARLRFIQLLSAGYEGPQIHGVPPGVAVANAGDSWSPAVAEHAMALLLALTKCLPQVVDNQSRHVWDRSFTVRMSTLDGRTLAIIGFGSIGREVARRARAFGMRVIGVSRSGRPHPLADEVQPVAALRSVLGRADVVLLAVPFSPESEHMIGADELAACKAGTVLINVARGGLIDNAALAAALRNGNIGGAALDVTEPEPLPPHDLLWDSPNLIISPHVAGPCGASGRMRLAEFVGANLERYVTGKPLTNVVSF